jgi:hypothetical protein
MIWLTAVILFLWTLFISYPSIQYYICFCSQLCFCLQVWENTSSIGPLTKSYSQSLGTPENKPCPKVVTNSSSFCSLSYYRSIAPYNVMLQMYHFTNIFLKFKSNWLVKSLLFLLNAVNMKMAIKKSKRAMNLNLGLRPSQSDFTALLSFNFQVVQVFFLCLLVNF